MRKPHTRGGYINTVLIYWIAFASLALPSVPVVMYVCVSDFEIFKRWKNSL